MKNISNDKVKFNFHISKFGRNISYGSVILCWLISLQYFSYYQANDPEYISFHLIIIMFLFEESIIVPYRLINNTKYENASLNHSIYSTAELSEIVGIPEKRVKKDLKYFSRSNLLNTSSGRKNMKKFILQFEKKDKLLEDIDRFFDSFENGNISEELFREAKFSTLKSSKRFNDVEHVNSEFDCLLDSLINGSISKQEFLEAKDKLLQE